MYFPYFRAKREELFAAREAAGRIAAKKVVFPIFEPVRNQAAQLIETTRQLCQVGVPHAVIANPRVGDLRDDHPRVENDIVVPACALGTQTRPALIIDARVTDAEIAQFFNTYSARQLVLIHKTSFRNAGILKQIMDAAGNVEYNLFAVPGTSASYRSVFSTYDNALLSDAFVRQARNEDYGAVDPEHFTSEHLNYAADNQAGFADYVTVGDHWTEGGGPAHAVTLHVTYPEDDGTVWIRHFVSDDVGTPADREGKTLQAIAKAVSFANHGGLAFSTAVPEWVLADQTSQAPGLAMLKRQSMRHHLELIDSLL